VWSRWFSRRALLLHLYTVLIIAACLTACWWQVTRALAGNGLSWFYSFEWPGFALVALAAWWHLVHEDEETRQARKTPADAAPAAQRKAEW